AQAGAGPGGPPTLYGHPGLATLQELAAAQPLGQGNAALDGASMRAMMARADGQLREMYLRSAHLQPAAEAARPARAARLRRRVRAGPGRTCRARSWRAGGPRQAQGAM